MSPLRRLLLALVALCAGASAQAEPAMWRVEGPRGSAILFGSFHLLPPGVPWRSPALEAALSRADELWFEIPLGGPADVKAGEALRRAGLLPPGQSLADRLEPADVERLSRDAHAVGLDPGQLLRQRPWMADLLLSGAAATEEGASASRGVEASLDALAPPRVKRRALETVGGQLKALDVADSIAVAELRVTLGEIETSPHAYADLVAAWAAGDLDRLRVLAVDPLRRSAPEAYDRLIVARNAAFTRVVAARLRRPGLAVFVVGAGHLLGPEGVPERLRALGYRVTGP